MDSINQFLGFMAFCPSAITDFRDLVANLFGDWEKSLLSLFHTFLAPVSISGTVEISESFILPLTFFCKSKRVLHQQIVEMCHFIDFVLNSKVLNRLETNFHNFFVVFLPMQPMILHHPSIEVVLNSCNVIQLLFDLNCQVNSVQ